jgi:hypothetical protein
MKMTKQELLEKAERVMELARAENAKGETIKADALMDIADFYFDQAQEKAK